MKRAAVFLSMILYFGFLNASAQTDNSAALVPLENISTQISRISKSLEDLNIKLNNFSQTFDSNQGLRLTDKQQRLLFAFEMLNRAETRLSTLQLLKIQLADRQATTNRKIAQVDDSLRAENVDRTLNGSLNAEDVRNARRRTLQNEKNELTKLLYEIQNSINDTDSEITETQMFLRRIRRQIFPNVEREISDL